jgi:hypothetical protein
MLFVGLQRFNPDHANGPRFSRPASGSKKTNRRNTTNKYDTDKCILQFFLDIGINYITWYLLVFNVLYFPSFDRPLFRFLQADTVAGETIMHGDTVYIKAWIGTTFDFDAS